MTDATDLERRYRRWLRWYPGSFRREHEDEILGVLMATARDGQRRPDPMECLDLMGNGLRMRLRPTLTASDRSAARVVRLMYAGAVVELAAAVVILATMGDVSSSVIRMSPGYTEAHWRALAAGQVEPVALAAGIAVAFWLWMAWAIGRGHRSARIAFAIFFGVNAFGLFHGLAQGSAVYARADLVVGVVLCLIQFAAVVLMCHEGLRKASLRSGLRRIGGNPAG